jgi:hypothetical protein
MTGERSTAKESSTTKHKRMTEWIDTIREISTAKQRRTIGQRSMIGEESMIRQIGRIMMTSLNADASTDKLKRRVTERTDWIDRKKALRDSATKTKCETSCTTPKSIPPT